MTSLAPLDLRWIGHPQSIASLLLRSGSTNILIDPGPSICLPTLQQQLASRGLRISDLQYLLLTHIHLDHAGATGSLLLENPNLEVYVHERGAPHLVAPENLLKSARRLYGDTMEALFGQFLPVPQALPNSFWIFRATGRTYCQVPGETRTVERYGSSIALFWPGGINRDGGVHSRSVRGGGRLLDDSRGQASALQWAFASLLDGTSPLSSKALGEPHGDFPLKSGEGATLACEFR